jgi:hypothetical protein
MAKLDGDQSAQRVIDAAVQRTGAGRNAGANRRAPLPRNRALRIYESDRGAEAHYRRELLKWHAEENGGAWPAILDLRARLLPPR